MLVFLNLSLLLFMKQAHVLVRGSKLVQNVGEDEKFELCWKTFFVVDNISCKKNEVAVVFICCFNAI